MAFCCLGTCSVTYAAPPSTEGLHYPMNAQCYFQVCSAKYLVLAIVLSYFLLSQPHHRINSHSNKASPIVTYHSRVVMTRKLPTPSMIANKASIIVTYYSRVAMTRKLPTPSMIAYKASLIVNYYSRAVMTRKFPTPSRTLAS